MSSSVIEELEGRNVDYILGVRMRRVREVAERVLSGPAATKRWRRTCT